MHSQQQTSARSCKQQQTSAIFITPRQHTVSYIIRQQLPSTLQYMSAQPVASATADLRTAATVVAAAVVAAAASAAKRRRMRERERARWTG
eukprot:827713-Pyramimonas_sp.AAC.1